MDKARKITKNCNICITKDDLTSNPAHLNSPEHVFNYLLYEWNNSRKSLVKDRHGVRIEAVPAEINGTKPVFQIDSNKGTYTIKVSPEQFIRAGKIELLFSIHNDQKNNKIYIIRADLLHPYKAFTKFDLAGHLDNKNFPALPPKAKYEIKVCFKLDKPTIGSFTMPLACTFQTEDGKVIFTIIREVVIFISNDENEQTPTGAVKKSPFTCNIWKDIKTVIPSTKQLHGSNMYPIPEEDRRILDFGLCEFRGMTSVEHERLNFIRNQLEPNYPTPANYTHFFHYLLWLEEGGEALMLRRYNMENVTVKILSGEILELEVPGLAEKRPSLVVGDTVRIRITNDHIVYIGSITQILDSCIHISYVDPVFLECIADNPELPLDVAFELGRLAFERMHQGVTRSVNNGLTSVLFPEQALAKKKVPHTINIENKDFFNPDITTNAEQKTAVIKIVNCCSQKAPYIVYGPPGTGKTVTIVEAILQVKKMHRGSRILVCAPANAACDMLALKLLEFCNRKKDLIRIHSDVRDRGTVPEKLHDYSNPYIDGKYASVLGETLSHYRIVVTTLILCGKYSGKYYPDFVFVDEAAQGMEPEIDCAVSLLTLGKQLILAGDPKQLGPLCSSKVTEKYGLHISILERLMNTNELYQTHNSNFITMLRLNFRAHPDVLKIPNELFYEGKLKAVSRHALEDPISKIFIYPKIFKQQKTKADDLEGAPVEFVAINSKEKREGRSPSYFNEMEIQTIIKYVETLVNLSKEDNVKVDQTQIGIVTPYVRQVYRLKDHLKQRGLTEIEIGTTETFQGREKRIIIVSTVRAQHSLLLFDRRYKLGFVSNEKRFNVALTRAKSKLIVIGCPYVLCYDQNWLTFIEYCEELNAYFGPSYIQRTEEVRKAITARFKHVQSEDEIKGKKQ